jgi:tartrate-resistant acid phosphatase type 5
MSFDESSLVALSAPQAMTSTGMSKTPNPEPVDEAVMYPAAETVVRFIAIDDSSTGEDGQYKVADAMQDVCEQRGCEFAIGLGDNIYESGVDGVHDIQFDTKFEDPYKNIGFPFYMALGNHDNTWIIAGDGADNDKGEIQVEYHYRTDRKSDKWQMPASYYQFGAPLNTSVPLVEFFAMDTNPSASAGDPSNEYNKDDYSELQGK